MANFCNDMFKNSLMVSQCDQAGVAIFALMCVGDHRVRSMEWSHFVLPQEEEIVRL